ncbi:protein arginine n-methyltransferase [Striga asiatica]|uniref:type I protein arginine methyltransferase n=1 Tax=Striga asiatica TaxID=4170 RepID=A0A5A7PCP6_STRAF|nr:protein arginine n-methyltransferase [Striga asiatica]
MANNKMREQDFLVASISQLSISGNPSPPVVARFRSRSLQFGSESSSSDSVEFDLQSCQLFKLSPSQSLCISEASEKNNEESYSAAITIQFRNQEECSAFHCAFEQCKKEVVAQGLPLSNGIVSSSTSKFDDKIEASSSKMYFHYYGQLLHQQNMLQDYVRTGSYYAAVLENRVDFTDRVVVDVGAGSGILSLFAAQAGAKHVYAVEASEMADYARKLIAGNPSLSQRITVIKGKVEEVELPEKADILISEPMGMLNFPLSSADDDCLSIEHVSRGHLRRPPQKQSRLRQTPCLDHLSPWHRHFKLCTLLVNERMLESYIIARDRFLIPNGKMFPTIGRIHMAPFSDEYLFIEIANKALFWQQQNYYGVNLTPLHGTAFQGYFSQNTMDIRALTDYKLPEEELYEIDIPLRFVSSVGARIHGLACWFDVLFNGRWLTTAPGAPTTHWYQLRCVLEQPIYVMPGQEITGRFRMVAHKAQSYTLYLTLSAKMWGPGAEQGGIIQTSSGKLDLKEPYYRMSQPQAYPMSQDQQSNQLLQTQHCDSQTESQSELPKELQVLVEIITASVLISVVIINVPLERSLDYECGYRLASISTFAALVGAWRFIGGLLGLEVELSLAGGLLRGALVGGWRSIAVSGVGPRNSDITWIDCLSTSYDLFY